MDKKIDTWDRHEDDWKGSFNFVLVIYFVIMFAFITVRVIAGLGWLSNLPPAVVEIGFSIVSQVLIMTAIPLFAVHAWRRKRRDTTIKETFASKGFDKPTWRVLGFAVLLGAIAYFFNIFISGLFNGVLAILGYRFPGGGGVETWSGVSGLFVLLALVAVLPGFCEEVTHRGMLMRSFIPRLGVMKAILFSSVMFGFMHLNVVQVFYAAILGYIIALATVATKSLWVGVIMHFMNNAMGIYFMFAYRYGWIGGGLMNALVGALDILGLILYALVIFGGFFAMMAIIRMFARENFQKKKSLHIAQLIQTDPNILKHSNGVYSFEEFHDVVDKTILRMGNWQRLKFFLEPTSVLGNKRPRLNRAEATLFWGVLFLGGIITTFTLVWGFL